MQLTNLNTYCINLDRRPDRLLKVQKEFVRIGAEFSRFPAIDGKFLLSLEPENGDKICRNHAGCLFSHFGVWKKALENKTNVLAVFEDDVVFADDFVERFPKYLSDLPSNWQYAHLGSYQPLRAPLIPVTEYVAETRENGWGTQGYLLRESAIHKLIDGIGRPKRIDAYLYWTLIKHGIKMYTPCKKLCYQYGDKGDIPSTDNSQSFREIREREVKHQID